MLLPLRRAAEQTTEGSVSSVLAKTWRSPPTIFQDVAICKQVLVG